LKEIPARLIEFSFIFLIIIIFLFLFVNCKIENVQLKTKYEILNEKFADLEKELAGTRETYSKTLIFLIRDHKISWDELSRQLPEHEIKYLQVVLLAQEKVNKK